MRERKGGSMKVKTCWDEKRCEMIEGRGAIARAMRWLKWFCPDGHYEVIKGKNFCKIIFKEEG